MLNITIYKINISFQDEDFVRAVALSLGLQINEHILGDGNCFFKYLL